MPTQHPHLFQPLTLGAIALPNRVVMAPLTRSRAAAAGHVPHELNAEYYAQRASAGLIISEASQISPQGIGYPDTPGIHTPEQVAGWRLVTDAVHAAGGRIVCQLWHVGRISHPDFQPGGALPVSASAVKPPGNKQTPSGKKPYVTPRALETDEVPGVVDDYAHATRCARDAGFDGVEVHAANSYLIDQFLRTGTNHRTDRYGGPLPHRLRFLLEAVAACADAWSADRVGVRLSPQNHPDAGVVDDDPRATFTAAAGALRPLGLAYLHVLEAIDSDTYITRADDAITPELRHAFAGPLIANAGYTAATAEHAVATGAADAVAFGRAYIANPDLAERFRTDAALNEPDTATYYGGGAAGYTDYPTLA